MKKKNNLGRLSVFIFCFLLFAFTLPAISWTPELAKADPQLATPQAESVASPVQQLHAPADKISAEEEFEEYLEDLFDEMDLRRKGMNRDVFRRAMTGYQNLKRQNLVSPQKAIISIVDFSKASRHKRLWVLDLDDRKVLFHSYVAHGQGSGEDKPYAFSNRHNSHQSSLGFYITAGTYFGKHGLSLKLNGMDAGFNTNALDRAIVVHGADYVSKDFIKAHGRLGRSHGCPAVPQDLKEPIINTIKDKTVLYIDAGIVSYSSVYLDQQVAANYFAAHLPAAKVSI